jgi:hypothetical protein
MRKLYRAVAQAKQTKGYLYYNNNYQLWLTSTTEIVSNGIELIYKF